MNYRVVCVHSAPQWNWIHRPEGRTRVICPPLSPYYEVNGHNESFYDPQILLTTICTGQWHKCARSRYHDPFVTVSFVYWMAIGLSISLTWTRGLACQIHRTRRRKRKGNLPMSLTVLTFYFANRWRFEKKTLASTCKTYLNRRVVGILTGSESQWRQSRQEYSRLTLSLVFEFGASSINECAGDTCPSVWRVMDAFHPPPTCPPAATGDRLTPSTCGEKTSEPDPYIIHQGLSEPVGDQGVHFCVGGFRLSRCSNQVVVRWKLVNPPDLRTSRRSTSLCLYFVLLNLTMIGQFICMIKTKAFDSLHRGPYDWILFSLDNGMNHCYICLW